MKRDHSIHNKTMIFLMEISISIFFFTLLLCIALKFFVTAHNYTKDSITLEQAVTWCENVANICQNSNGTLEELQSIYPESIILEDQAILYLDSSFLPVTTDNAYQIKIDLQEQEENRETEIQIRFVDTYGTDIYQLKTYVYHPRSPFEEGGSADAI